MRVRSLAFVLLLAACNTGVGPGNYHEGEPYQREIVLGDAKKLAVCTGRALTALGMPSYIAHDPKADYYVLNHRDMWAVTFDPETKGTTRVETRGMGYLWSSIPPWSEKAMAAVKGCEGK